MRIRTIKPQFHTSRDIRRLKDAWTRLLFIGLWNFADDAGRFEFDPDVICGSLFPSDSIDIVHHLNELKRAGLIHTYFVGNDEFACIPSWFEHQRIDKPQLPRTPDLVEIPGTFPLSWKNIPCRKKKHNPVRQEQQSFIDDVNPSDDKDLKKFPEHSRLEGKGREGKGKERKKCMSPTGDESTHTDSDVEHILSIYPKVSSPATAKKKIVIALKKLSKTDKDPVTFLLERVQAFADSPKGKGRWIPAPAKFFEEERYFDNPAAWEDGDFSRSANEKEDRIRKRREKLGLNPDDGKVI